MPEESLWAELARGSPTVVALVVVGGLVWRAASPLLMKLMEAIAGLSENIRDMTSELGRTNTEIRVMSQRLDILERQVARVSPPVAAEAMKQPHGQTN